MNESRLYERAVEQYSEIDQDRVVCLDCGWWVQSDADIEPSEIHTDDVCPNPHRRVKREILRYLGTVEDASLRAIQESVGEETSVESLTTAIAELIEAGEIYERNKGVLTDLN